MLVQYLVALCCLRRNADAVDVTVGDMVLDTAAAKERDVDVTVTLNEADGTVRAFKAYEVKRESEPLDVATVEQLCIKLRDMPAVTHRAIVSASGFTDGAIAKAAAHGVELYVLRPWTEPLAAQFPAFRGVGRAEEFLSGVSSSLLCWVDWTVSLLVPDGPRSFTYDGSWPVYGTSGAIHGEFATLGLFLDAVLLRSTEILFPLEPAQTALRTFPLEPMADNEEVLASPAWPHTHTLSVAEDNVLLKFDGRPAQVTSVTISGRLQWQRRKRVPEFHVLERVPTREAFAGAAVADWGSPDGKMLALVFVPDSRTVGIHTIQLQPRHKNAIRRLRVPLPTDPIPGA